MSFSVGSSIVIVGGSKGVSAVCDGVDSAQAARENSADNRMIERMVVSSVVYLEMVGIRRENEQSDTKLSLLRRHRGVTRLVRVPLQQWWQ